VDADPPMTVDEQRWRDPAIVGAALTRGVVIVRAGVTIVAGSAGLLLVAYPQLLVFLILFVVLATIIEVNIMVWWPAIVRTPVWLSLIDTFGMIGALAVTGPGFAYFCYAAGCAAASGALLGLRAVPVWIVQATVSYVAAIRFLAEYTLPAEVQVFVLACPMAGVVCGVGGAIARAVVDTQVNNVLDLVQITQRSAAASERARLARELHDSLAKTLRGVSFAALALPSSLRRHPELAEQLASTVSAGVEAAAEQARGLVTGLRLDSPQQPFAAVIEEMSRDWSGTAGVAIDLDLALVEPDIAVRYELLCILGEALTNVERHAAARRVLIRLRVESHELRLLVADDGRGLPRQRPGPSDSHFGIVGMSERARSLGGSLEVSARPSGGTAVVATVPARLVKPTLAGQ